MICIKLPFPVSSNNLYANRKGGRYKTKRYETWLNAAGWDIKEQKPKRLEGPYQITLLLDNSRRFNKDGTRKKIDASNFIKAPSDLLVAHGIIEDDSLEERVVLQWSDTVKGCLVILEPAEEQRRAA